VAKTEPALAAVLMRPEVQEFIKAGQGRDFTIQDVIDYSVIRPLPEKARRCADLLPGRDIRVSYDEWTWPYQRIITSPKGVKNPVKNYVFRLDWLTAADYFGAEVLDVLKRAVKLKTFHPNNHATPGITLGWVRYSIWKAKDAVVMDEIQSDIGPALRKLNFPGWAEKVAWYFLTFCFQHLRHERILIPDAKTKVTVYGSRLAQETADLLYEKLPKRLGALPDKLHISVHGKPADFWVVPAPGQSERQQAVALSNTIELQGESELELFSSPAS
jgi:hypothetical protein